MNVETQDRLKRLADRIPEGKVAEAYVYGLLALGALASAKSKSEKPAVAVIQGLFGATVANTTSSVLLHRAGVHGSMELTPRATEAGRIVQAAIVGLRTDRGAAAHRVHHEHTDGPEDPHSPANEGRWKVFTGITGLIRKFGDEHPELVAQEQSNPYTRKRWFDKAPITAAGIVGTHIAVGKAIGQPVGYRLFSAAVHVMGEYILNATFTADSHNHGKAHNLGLSPLTSMVMGGEDDHAGHHEDPKNPRHGKYDPGYALARGLEAVGLATMPSQLLPRRLFTRKAA